MKCFVFEGWLLLLYFDYIMRFRGFSAVHRLVRQQGIRPASAADRVASERLCHAVDLACVLYFKRVMCLQRSAAAAILLRRHGWKAEMVIGAQLLPFRSHAWVEIDGDIVNDKPYMLDIYRVLERC